MGKKFISCDHSCDRLFFCYEKGCSFKSEDIIEAERHQRSSGHKIIILWLEGKPDKLSEYK